MGIRKCICRNNGWKIPQVGKRHGIIITLLITVKFMLPTNLPLKNVPDLKRILENL